LKGADRIFETQDYKQMIRNSALLFADKTHPAYLDLTMLINKKTGTWDYNLYTASEFMKEVNKDIERFIHERARENASREQGI
jgi:hypothetical protein